MLVETEAAPAIFVEQFDKMFSSGLVPFSIALESDEGAALTCSAIHRSIVAGRVSSGVHARPG